MNAGGRRELIDGLCALEGRGPGTDAERRAANWLVGRLKAQGRRARVEPIHVHPEYSLVIGLHLLLAIVGSLLALTVPIAGFAVILFAATSLYLDQSTRLYLLRRLFFRRASQVVISPGPRPDARLRVVLTAHYDSAKTGFIFGGRTTRVVRRVPPRLRMLLGPLRLLFWLGIVPLLLISAVRLAGVDSPALDVIQLIPTALCLVGIALGIDIALSSVVPGACDNASGVAAVLSAAAQLDADPPPGVDLWVILPGGEEANAEGMAAYLRANRRDFDPASTIFVNLDSVSYGTPHFITAEGALVSYGMDRRLIKMAGEIDLDGASPQPIRVPLHTDALPAAIRGLAAISIVGADDGVGAPWYHTHDDTPERTDDEALSRATAMTVELVRAIDREI